jgi:cytoskeletal protein CcmA (bactofilin family)
MFSKSSRSQNSASAPAAGARPVASGKGASFSILGGDVTVRGDIEASVDLHIDGRVEGDIVCAGLVQGVESRIKGNVTAQSARISGIVEGAIETDDLVIDASARVIGDVTYRTISIAAGGKIDGKLTHKDPMAQGDLKLVKS